jgi:acetyltransferase
VDRTGTSVILRLNDGRSVSIRPILPTDLDALRIFYTALSPTTRALRFHVSMKELPEDLLREFTAVDDCAHVAFVAEDRGAAVDRPGALVAEARYIRQADSDSAEFALVVADDWCRTGLGTSLVRALLRNARFAGLRRLCGDVLADNKATRRFLDSLGARPAPGAGDNGTVRLCLEPQAG